MCQNTSLLLTCHNQNDVIIGGTPPPPRSYLVNSESCCHSSDETQKIWTLGPFDRWQRSLDEIKKLFFLIINTFHSHIFYTYFLYFFLYFIKSTSSSTTKNGAKSKHSSTKPKLKHTTTDNISYQVCRLWEIFSLLSSQASPKNLIPMSIFESRIPHHYHSIFLTHIVFNKIFSAKIQVYSKIFFPCNLKHNHNHNLKQNHHLQHNHRLKHKHEVVREGEGNKEGKGKL